MAHPEASLLTALLIEGKITEAESLGLLPGHWHEYKIEYEWCFDYRLKYKNSPTSTTFREAFPDFPWKDTGVVDLEYLIDQVKENHLKVATTKLAREMTSDLRSGDHPLDVMSKAAKSIMTVTRGLDGGHTVASGKESEEEFSWTLERMTTTAVLGNPPFAHQTLQEQTSGLGQGDLCIKAARLGQGKTFDLVNDSVQAVMEGKKVLFYSLEMNRRQMGYRFHTVLSHRLGHKIKNTEIAHARNCDVLAYKALLADIKDKVPGDWFIDDTTRGKVTPHTIAAGIDKHAPDLVVVDYMTLLGSVAGGRSTDGWNTAATIVGELKDVATQFRTPILSAAQINREGERASWRPPKVVHLAQTDSIGQDADYVVTMKRFAQGAMVYSLEKNRHGQSGSLWFARFDPEHGDFHEITRTEAESIRDTEGEYKDDQD